MYEHGDGPARRHYVPIENTLEGIKTDNCTAVLQGCAEGEGWAINYQILIVNVL